MFLQFPFFESWFCTLSTGHIDGSLFVHQILWVLLMVSIDHNDMTHKHKLKIKKNGQAQISFISEDKAKYKMGISW